MVKSPLNRVLEVKWLSNQSKMITSDETHESANIAPSSSRLVGGNSFLGVFSQNFFAFPPNSVSFSVKFDDNNYLICMINSYAL